MPRQPQPGRQHRSVTLSDDNWEPGELIAEAMGTTRSQLVEALWAYFMRRPGAELPERPPQELIDRADAAWEERKARIRARALTLPCPSCKVESGPCLAGKAKRPTNTMIHRPRLIKAGAEIAEEERAAETDSDA
ncbi:hypothetical protein [Actinomadura litoris]|uniref:Uncharacterized protein n=1 Tax=Actinomadura litoris TaxID=2678616 RepID=A0A7K1LAJ1_9ACTN|nr:hypothetical protein [Actinomadura litoris]MUN41439.1 hypothetical protein [Actinomadura litoris]